MPHREFTDPRGRTWEVWEVSPETIADVGGAGRPTAWSTCERQLEAGWLCFSCPQEKRRLAPFPAGWFQLAPAELATLCLEARVVPARVPRDVNR